MTMRNFKKIVYCKSCVYPINAVNLSLESDGICSACHTVMALKENTIDPTFWENRKTQFLDKVQKIHSKNPERNKDFDCIVPVSGGKDSYYQVHVVTSLGLKPLLVTYHGNNYLPEGDRNRDNMKNVFNTDHIVYSPSTEVLIKLNRIGFRKLGDMNWHAHCGISTLPHVIACKLNIPLVIWGETPWDISGMYFQDDEAEFSYQNRHDHDCRGYEWYDFVDDSQDLLSPRDLWWAKYPNECEIQKVGLTGIYIGNYFPWEPNTHTQLVQNLYNWMSASTPFERTYRKISNLDDRYENGVHDLLKYIKFGYGRASDHASKDIRSGDMTRQEGIANVQKYDHIVSSDLQFWLKYVNYSEEKFWQIADTFREPNVWTLDGKFWIKDSIWGSPVSEPVRY
jgi:N-acetyl sugar amidotransferase